MAQPLSRPGQNAEATRKAKEQDKAKKRTTKFGRTFGPLYQGIVNKITGDVAAQNAARHEQLTKARANLGMKTPPLPGARAATPAKPSSSGVSTPTAAAAEATPSRNYTPGTVMPKTASAKTAPAKTAPAKPRKAATPRVSSAPKVAPAVPPSKPAAVVVQPKRPVTPTPVSARPVSPRIVMPGGGAETVLQALRGNKSHFIKREK